VYEVKSWTKYSTHRVVSPSLDSTSRVSGSTRQMSVSTSRVSRFDSSCLAFASTRRALLRFVVLILTAGSTRRLLAYCKMNDEFIVEAP
jgi:ABC-type transporter Mla MlaB component